jgi:hypothetical protein
LAKYAVPDLTMGEFSAKNWELSCLFLKKPDFCGFLGKMTGFQGLKCALIAPIGGRIVSQMTQSP